VCDIGSQDNSPWPVAAASYSRKSGPSDPVGVVLVDAAFTPDGKYYAYSCFNALSQLYLVEGLR